MAKKRKIAENVWLGWLLVSIAAITLLRELFNASGVIPAHFDEAQYWTYGEALAFGYYSKPPLVAWAIRLSTEVFGDTLFGLRFFVPLVHAWIAWLIFASGRRLFDARTGFWAGLGYLAAPGVTVSAGLMTTDPLMMLGWAGALYALTRILTLKRTKKTPEPWAWWAVLGLSLGAGMLAKYTAIAFAGGAIGYALFSREGARTWRGPLLAAGCFLLVWAPNLIWLGVHRFASVAHLGENADTGQGISFGGLPEFIGAQAGVIGPIFLVAIFWAAAQWREWRGEWRKRLLFWLTAPLFLAMCVQSLNGGANANWAAPCYVAGSIIAACFLTRRGWRRGLMAHLVIGAVATVLLWSAGAVYSQWGTGLPRAGDPYKKVRIGPPFCERVILAMEDTGVETLLSNDRRRLAECSFLAALPPSAIRVWNPEGMVSNHYEMVASLTEGERNGPMLLVTLGDGARIARHFASSERIDEGVFATHVDREFDYSIWRVNGFLGYDTFATDPGALPAPPVDVPAEGPEDGSGPVQEDTTEDDDMP
ncbi:glycosyltransferase family 39 protein [Oceanicella sp. SM1341]|uniref:ArnT family glycosyltransferase n=1 Tax=Oceanicella sp. SM1341 TaxID=1548889 RepID=UPI000E48FD47|nr:glycosyltransferase family 39 protein [Oceanicella sp. SM1341]